MTLPPPTDPTPPEHTRPRVDESLELVGERRARFGPGDLEAFPLERRTVEIVCASGSRHTSTWGGVAIPDLLAAGEVPDATTHLVIESTDGFTACVGVEAAVEGVLARRRDGRPLVEDHPYASRFVSPDVDGTRAVKGVCRIEAATLAADERPGDYEHLETESPEMG